MKKIILGFAGQIASGKGTSSKYLVERYGAKAYRFSTVLREILQRLRLPESRANLQDLALALVETFGDDVLANELLGQIEQDDQAIITIDGIRREGDMEKFRKHSGFRLVYIEADIDTRYKRMKENGENANDKNKTFEEFKKDHEKKNETAIAGFKIQADYLVDNNGSFDQLQKQLDEIIQKEIS